MRPMNVPGAIPQAARKARYRGEFVQDAAVPGVLRLPAQLPQTPELFFQRPQLPNALGDMPDAIAKAMARGRASTPTVRPAEKSCPNWARP